MSSILTNTSAMVALQTLKMVNKDLGTIQSQISTGLKVGSARDNAATWAVASVMRSDVSGLKIVSEALNLGASTLGVARDSSESISKILQSAKESILQGGDLTNEDTRNKVIASLTAAGNTINTIVASASFNGVNLIDNADARAITSSLTRAADGTLGVQTIAVAGVDLTGVGAVLTGLTEASLTDAAAIDATLALIEAEFTTAIDAAAAFGTSQKQVDIQSEFVGKFIDSLNSGIGALVDADLEEASARLQALQVQQQLGTQALSIANQAPQSVLALFR